jgi:Fungal protein kinase
MFVSAILGFLWMNEEELGFDPTIVEEDGKRYTEIWRNGQVERLCLEELMKQQRSAVGRATTCWKGCLSGGKPDHQPAIKDSWEYEERPEEGLLLKEATEAGMGMWRGTTTMKLCALGAVDDVRNNVRNGSNEASGRNAFQQRRPVVSETITSPATSGSSGPGRGRGRSRSITRKRLSSCI